MAGFNWPNAGQFGVGQGYNFPSYSTPNRSPYSVNNYPYYNPSNGYGGDRDWKNTPVIGGPGGYLENSPDALYTRFISPWASGDDGFSRYVQSQYNNVYGGYEAAFADNPNMTFADYLRGFTPDWFAGRWGNLTPNQQGRNDARFGAGRMQWLV